MAKTKAAGEPELEVRQLTRTDKSQFQKLLDAAREGRLCAVTTLRMDDKQQVVLICEATSDGKGYSLVEPLAVMIEGDPTEKFMDPTTVRTKNRRKTGGKRG